MPRLRTRLSTNPYPDNQYNSQLTLLSRPCTYKYLFTLIFRFAKDDVEGVLERANNTEFGLASGVLTNDINKAMIISENIEAGTCFVNVYNKTDVAAPFGGFKQSGFGKDLGQEALSEYLKTKTVIFEYSS